MMGYGRAKYRCGSANDVETDAQQKAHSCADLQVCGRLLIREG